MKRRDFIKSGAAVVGIAGAPNLLPKLLEGEAVSQKSPKPSGKNAAAPKENRSAEYLRRAKTDKFLPKPPVFAASKLTPDVDISPMPLVERLKRNIVPRKGFCSTSPGKTTSDGITSGNGHMNIEVASDPYSEQILFHHESLLVPWKRPFEAPKAANVFPEVRQLALDGKYQESIELAFKEMGVSYKCRLAAVGDNSGYTGVVLVVRDGGSAKRDGDTRVIENASSV